LTDGTVSTALLLTVALLAVSRPALKGGVAQDGRHCHKADEHLDTGFQNSFPLFLLVRIFLPLIVMPLDHEEHARAKHDRFEDN